ncbi:type I restriction endonuclease subunit R, partial [Actinocrinis puniceicyclus]
MTTPASHPQPYAESAFESAIETDLLASGWHRYGGTYDAALALDTSEVATFVGTTQNDAWERLRSSYGGDRNTTQREFNKRLAREIDQRGALDVLRHGVKDRGVTIDLAYFRPGHTLAANALDEYHANRLTVARQLHYSPRDPSKSLDLTLFLNGIPIATVELKSPLTAQRWTVEDAKRQYREDRDPNELLFARRALVHFAVDPDLVFLTTRLAGPRTRFLPFNVGSHGPGQSGGAGNPPAGNPASPTP